MSLLSIVTFPLHLLANLLRFIFNGLRLPFPTFSGIRLTLLNIYARFAPRPTAPSDPYTVADRWVRALEDETGAHCLSRARSLAAAGPSTVRHRYGTIGGRVLPDFVLGSYEEALRVCQSEARIGCIVLVSDEHDDVAEFKRQTLTDTTFVELLSNNNFVVWGGDVRDYEAWSAAQKLQATTYPFVAFVALQPQRNTAFSSATPRTPSAATLTVLSRHQGRAPTAPVVLTAHVTAQLLPRVEPFLARVRAAARERDLERSLRAEQDRAFAEAAARDREKIEMRVLEDKRAQAAAREAAERQARAEREAAARAENKARWRARARAGLVPPEAAGGDALRIGVRLPDGQRVIRAFARTDTVGALYCVVDTALVPVDPLAEAEDAVREAEVGLEELIAGSGQEADRWWGFKLFLAYPRREIKWEPEVELGSIDGLERGGQIVVEKVNGEHAAAAAATAGGDPDGYDTEESE